MRTTIDVDGAILHQAKQQAHARQTTLSRLLQEALVAFLQTSRVQKQAAFELITAGKKGDPCPSPRQIYQLLVDDELP